jgi:hypothetical protein
VNPVPDSLILRESGSYGNRILTTRPQRRAISLLSFVARYLDGVRQCAFLFLWYSSYDLEHGYVISARIISLYVWVGMHVGLHYPMSMLWLCVGPRLYHVLCSLKYFLSLRGECCLHEVLEVEVNLRPTVSQPVCRGARRPSGTRDQFFCLLEVL